MIHPEGQPLSFVEFARRKLEKTEHPKYNVIKTNVIIDGMILSESLGQIDEEELEKVESVQSFVKVQMEGSLSSSSISTTGYGTQNVQVEELSEDKLVNMVVGDDEDPRVKELEEMKSNFTEPGTLRSTVKTFKTQSQQTLTPAKFDHDINLKGIPARFEGTMVTPVYFEGRMLTPESLDQMMAEAAKKKEALTIPVSFEGGMLTAAFRSMKEKIIDSEAEGDGNVAVPVKFSGRLQGITEDSEGQGLPVTFDGTMATKDRKKISSLTGV